MPSRVHHPKSKSSMMLMNRLSLFSWWGFCDWTLSQTTQTDALVRTINDDFHKKFFSPSVSRLLANWIIFQILFRVCVICFFFFAFFRISISFFSKVLREFSHLIKFEHKAMFVCFTNYSTWLLFCQSFYVSLIDFIKRTLSTTFIAKFTDEIKTNIFVNFEKWLQSFHIG